MTGLRLMSVFVLLFFSVCPFCVAQEYSLGSPLLDQFQITSIPKSEWYDVYVGGKVTEQDGVTPIAGALVTATYLDDEGIGDIAYYDFIADPPHYVPNFGTESHCTTGPDGVIHLRIDVDANNVFWDADFNICVTREGYQSQCLSVGFDNSDHEENRFFFLVPNQAGTPTFTPTLIATETPTFTTIPTATPTNIPVGEPTAVHPELDVDGDGRIGAGDLLLLLADWMRPIN